jgi:hypothetical protein
MQKLVFILLMVMCVTVATNTYGQDKPYKDGSVWSVGFIKTSANMNKEYLKQLKNTWVAVHDEAIKQGLIISYKVLSGAAANPEDFDIMLLVEFRNMASLEGQDAKWDEIEKKIVGNEDMMKKLNETRLTMRTIYGGKLLREIVYK